MLEPTTISVFNASSHMRNKIQLSLFLTLLILGVQGKFTDSYAGQVDFTYTGECFGSPTVFTIDYSGLPIGTNVTTWEWDFGDGVFSNDKNAEHTYPSPGTYHAKLTIIDDNGFSYIKPKNVTILELPFPNFSFTIPNCSGQAIQFTDESDIAAGYFNYIDQWQWDFGDASPIEIITLSDDLNPKHTFQNVGTFYVTLTVTNSRTCENKITLPVNVTSSPVADFSSIGHCEEQVVAFSDESVDNGSVSIVGWNWDFDDVFSSGINNTSIDKNPSHIFSIPGTYNVKLVIWNLNGCTDTIIKPIVINPHPSVDFTNSTSCLGESISFIPDPGMTNITSWHWDFGDGITSNSASPIHSYWAPSDYPVTLSVTDILGCKNDTIHTIEVDPLPLAQFSTNLSYCAGGEVQFLDLSSTIQGYVSSWEWDFGDGNTVNVNFPGNPDVLHIYPLAGSYFVTLTIKSSTGCSGTITHLINIHPNPIAEFAFTKACTGTPVAFTDLTQLNGSSPIVLWQWDFGDPTSGISNFSSLQNPQHSFVATGILIPQLIVMNGNGCFDTVSHLIPVNPPPAVNFTTTNNCQNNAVSFVPDTSVMNLATIKSWYWDFGSSVSSVLINPTYTFTSAGTHIVILTVVDTAGCSSTISKSVSIAPEPNPDFSFTQPACSSTSLNFDNLSSATGGSFITQSEWDFGDGQTQTLTTLASVTHTYNSYGTYTAKLTVTTNMGCKKTLSLPVVILPRPLANFSFSGACLNSPVQFNDLSQPGVGGITSWQWLFGDPTSGINNSSNAKSPTHTYGTAGTFPVTLFVSNSGGCMDTIIKQVVVHGLPDVDFTFTPGCVNNATYFTSSTYLNSGVLVSCFWDFGDGQTSGNMDPAHTYPISGSFNVSLTVTDTAGCVNTKIRTIVISDLPSVLFDVSAQTCAGSPTSFSILPSASGSTVTSYLWEFGDGFQTLINAPDNGNVLHTYASGNTYAVVLTVRTSQGCEAKSQRIITVSQSPVAQFSSENSCSGEAVNFNDLSLDNSGPSIVSWSWNFDDPSSIANNTSWLKNPSHIFNSPGTYKVLLQVGNSSGCIDTVYKTILINQKPPVDFDWSVSCVGNATKFTTNTTITNVVTIASYDWDFGDGTAHSTAANPVHNYTVTGNHTVILSIVNLNGCKNSISHIINTSPQPNAIFSANSSCLGTSTEFVDQSFSSNGVPITGWHWDFGVYSATNDTSNQKNPSWTYQTLGVYQVKLTVTSQSGCQNTVIIPSQVFGNPTANFTYSVSPCGNGAVYFQDSSYNKQAPIASYNWEFESNHFSTLQDPVYIFYSSDSCYDVRLIATDIRGCVDTVVKKACVPAEFNFSFVASNTCLYDSTYFTPQQLGYSTGTLVSFNWNFGDANAVSNNTSTAKSPAHYYSQPGTYTVSLQATDVYNCLRVVYQDITILPLPVPYFSYTEGACDSSLYFHDASFSVGSQIKKWTWDFGDGIIETVIAPASPDLSHKYTVPGQYTVGLTVTNAAGCSIQKTVNDIMVKSCLDAAFDLNDTLICQNNTLSFYDNSSSTSPTNEWYWDFGDGTHLQYSNYINRINHVFTESGNFKVKLILSTFVGGKKVSDTAKMSVNVNATPLPDFIFATVCHEQTAVFTNMTSGNGTKIISYNWTFDEPSSDPQDTSTLKNPAHLYDAPGTYEVKLKVRNSLGCTDSIQKPLKVYGLPEANFSFSVSCAGDNTAFTDLSTASVAPLANWEWTYKMDDGIAGRSEVQNPGFVFENPGDYVVNLKVIDVNGCFDTINQNMSTWIVPKSLFSYTENYNTVQGQLQFINNSEDAIKYHWNFGNGTDSYIENPVTYYEDEGAYDISLITWNDKNCSDTLSMKYDFMVKGLFIPNAFSPNNTKQEVQLLKPVGINLSQYRFEVYDRWGNLLWWTIELDPEGRPVEGWDGKYKGTLMPEGAYTWKAFAVFKDGSIWDAQNAGNNDNLPKYKIGTSTMIN
jgi:PKD repeat protein